MEQHPTPPPNHVEHSGLAVLAHLSGLAIFIIPYVGAVVGPLVVWLLTREKSEFLDENGKEALNFQIFALIASLVLSVVTFVLFITVIGIVLAIPVALAAVIAWLYFIIKAAIVANRGEVYRYPWTIRFIS
ncbi:MAG: DUF4870 domain-containing protein [Planctomycetota bacterium]